MAQLSDLIKLTDAGFVYPDYPTILNWYKSEYRGIYGADTYLEADSQDGQWVAIQAQAVYDMCQIAAAVYSSFSPATAGLDALRRNVKINGMIPQMATNSTADVKIVGQVGTTITNGIVADANNIKWDLPASVVIPVSGEITVTATAQVSGNVVAPANTITKIITPSRGWQTVTNVAPATAGRDAETAAQLRARQDVSTMSATQTVLEAISASVQGVTGVSDIRTYENDTDTADANGQPAHSIALVVEGGDAQTIGETIALRKTPGCGTAGTTSITVGTSQTVRFYRPTMERIKVEVHVKALRGWLSGTIDKIKSSIVSEIDGVGIGNDVKFAGVYGASLLQGSAEAPTFDLLSVTIAKDGDTQASANIQLTFIDKAFAEVADITVTVTTA